jgi:hypothetical protein
MGDENFKAASGDRVEVEKPQTVGAGQVWSYGGRWERTAREGDRTLGMPTEDAERAGWTFVRWAPGFDPALAAPAATRESASAQPSSVPERWKVGQRVRRSDATIWNVREVDRAGVTLVSGTSCHWFALTYADETMDSGKWTLISEPEAPPNHLRNLATGEMTPTVAPKAPQIPHDYTDRYALVAWTDEHGKHVAPACSRCGNIDRTNERECVPWDWRRDRERVIAREMASRTQTPASPESISQRSPIANGAQSHVHPRGCLGIWDIRGGR